MPLKISLNGCGNITLHTHKLTIYCNYTPIFPSFLTNIKQQINIKNETMEWSHTQVGNTFLIEHSYSLTTKQ